MKTLFFVFAIVLLFVNNILSQTKWVVYSTSNSKLPHNEVRDLVFDSSGDLWIGTMGGIASYDGSNWSIYSKSNSSLPSNRVMDIALEGNNVWIATDEKGLIKYDRSTWTVYDYASCGLSPFVHRVTVAANGCKWIGTAAGLAMFDGTNWSFFKTTNSGLPVNWVMPVACDGKGNIWIGTSGGLVKYDGSNWSTFTSSNSPLPDNYIYDITSEGNTVWIGSDGGLTKYDGTNWTTFNTSNSGLPENKVMCIAINSNGEKWIGTRNSGLAKFDGSNWVVFNQSNSILTDLWIEAITFDSKGNTWIGTMGGGIAVYNESGIVSVPNVKTLNLPADFKLYQNYPNPFNPSTTISFSLPWSQFITLKIYDILGIEISTLVNEEKQPGNYKIKFDGSNLSSGIYYYQISAGQFVETKKFVLLK
ncbi:MAG: two-component regulator propeller domain-containing protein [Melioribacteraceae bacterium]|nr:two-component regulator propeller domain-containing protein [Melioribacteraceae bacterium]